MNEKRCSKCRKLKPTSDFYKDTSRRDGLMCWCKECSSTSGKKFRASHHYNPSNIASKFCPNCKTDKPIIKFRLSKYNRDGYCGWCNDCEKASQSIRRQVRPMENSVAQRKTRYGVTAQMFDEMLKSQNGVCAICGKVETRMSRYGTVRPLSIDHSHLTGEVRSLLCDDCNNGIARFHDSPDLLIRAAEYLRKYLDEKEQK